MNHPFTRDELRKNGAEKISGGRWANADLLLYTHTDGVWVLKDFTACSPLIRKTWGAWMAARELREYPAFPQILLLWMPMHSVIVLCRGPT